MLSVINIIKVLTETIEENFPGYPVNDRDVEENFPRPSSFIDVETVTGDNVTPEYVRETSQLVLYFFATDNYRGFLDLLKIKDKLLEILNLPLEIKDDSGNVLAHVTFDEVNVNIEKADKALTCGMTSVLIQQRNEDDDIPMMEDLDVNLHEEE
ncbi:DUF6838 family protein [Megasphaera sp.]|uniref:phage tail terminator family protein n=1 Tax=Megasphaera sp. TaxID=2023260 RepID=UPI0025C584B6|nr:hypothetical protein [Megasphaera sp.]MCF0154097.1 hypothetical protein [Megasphaera sp.]MCF0257928.1 hypothetical protein [Bacteroides heparinolyticus]